MNLLNRLKPSGLIKLLLVFLLTLLFSTEAISQEIQRIRINFTAPDNSVRQILLAFTPDNSATDNFDYGWDAQNWNQHSNDLNWLIEGYKCTVQAVGEFDNTKSYPLHILIGDAGTMNISLHSLENFSEQIDIYIFDSLENNFYHINDESFTQEIDLGEYQNRYFVTFTNNIELQTSLSNNNFDKKNIDIRFIDTTKELLVKNNSSNRINKIEMYTIDGKLLNNYTVHNQNYFKTIIPYTTSQIIIVRIISERGTISRKILI